MGLFSRLFAQAPRYHVSAYAPLYSAVVARLARRGVTVGGTAAIPRIEVHTITEGERLDKDGAFFTFEDLARVLAWDACR